MASFDALELLLSAKYIGAPAFRAMAADVEGLVASTSGLSRAGAAFNLLGTVVLGAGVAMAAGMAKAVTQAAAYDDAVQRMIAVGALHANVILNARDAHDQFTASLIANRNELQAFNAEVASAAVKYGISPTEVASGSYFLYSALPALKISAQQALGYNIINDLAAYVRASGPTNAGGVSFASAAQDLPRLFSGYNTPIQDWGGSLGIMTFLENNAHMTQAQLVQSMSKFLPAATALGMGFPDAATLMAALASSGVYGSRAGTEASSGLVSLFGGSKMNLTGLQALGIDTSKFFDKKTGKVEAPDQLMNALYAALSKLSPQAQLAAIHDTFGLIGMRAFGGLLETGMGKYNNLLGVEKGLGIYGNSAQAQRYLLAVSGQMMNAPGPKFESLKAALELLGITVGNKLTPFVMKLEDALTTLALKMDMVVASSHNLGQFLGNAIGALFGKGPTAGAAGMFGSIGAGMMGGSGGGVLLSLLGSTLVSGVGLKGVGKGLGFLGGIDESMMAGYAKRSGLLKDLESKFELKSMQLEASKKLALAPYTDGSGTVQVGRGPGKISQARLDALEARYAQKEDNLGALQEFQLNKLTGGKSEEAFKGPKNLGSSIATQFREMSAAVTAEVKKLPGQVIGVFQSIAAGVRAAIGGIASIARTVAGGVVSAFNGVKAVGGFFLDVGKTVGSSLGAIALHLRNLNLGAALGEFRNLASYINSGFMAAFSAVKNVVVSLATGGFRLLITAVTQGIPVLIGFAAPILVIIAVLLVVAGVVAVAVLAFTRFRTETMAAIQPLLTVGVTIFNIFAATVRQVMAQIGQAWDSAWKQISPAMKQLLAAIQQMTPVWQVLGVVIGSVVAVILAVLTGLVNGFIRALPPIINFFTGIVQLITHVAQIVVDIFTGQWGKIPGLIGSIFMDVLHILGSAVSAIISFIAGFIQGFISFFQHLFDVLVGHSIIPDMITAIVRWIVGLPGKTLGAIAGWVGNLLASAATLELQFVAKILDLVTQVGQKFIQMAASAIQWGAQVVQGFISGIQSMVGNAVSAATSFAGNVVNTVKNFLGIHSPSTMFTSIGQDSAQGYINGIQSKSGAAAAAASSAANNAAKAFASPSALASAYAAGESLTQALADGTYAQNVQTAFDVNAAARAQGRAHTGGGAPHFAAGGTMPYTGWATVGEHGKEMVFLPGGAHILNHNQTLGLLNPHATAMNPSGGGGGHALAADRPITLTHQMPHDFYDRIADAVARGHQQGGGDDPRGQGRNTMQQARQVQSLREELIGRYDRRSGFENQYRYAVQYTQ